MQQYFVKGNAVSPVTIEDKETSKHMFQVMRLKEDDEVALVFAEHLEVPTASILFELAQVFPQYKVYLEGTQIKMAKVYFDEEVLEELTPETQLLSRVTKLKGNVIKLASFNQDELVELLSQYKGQTVYYGFAQRECLAYIVQK